MSDARGRGLAFVPYVVVGVLQMASKVLEHVALDRITRPLLMPALAVPVLLALRRAPTRTLALLLLGIALSWLGDLTLQWFVVGLGCFLLAHLAYLAMLWTFSGRASAVVTVLAAFVASAWWVGLLALLWPHLGPLKVPVVVYGAALLAMATMATRGGVVVAVGGVAFVLSDSGLAFRTFTPLLEGRDADVVIMGLYVVAQGLIVFGMLQRLAGSTRGAAVVDVGGT